MLSVCTRTITEWTKSGRLVSHTFKGDGAGRRPLYYLRGHITEMRAAIERGDSVTNTRDVALRALATATTNERRLNELYDAMGLGVEPLARDPDSILLLFQSTYEELHPNRLRTSTWVRFWAGALFGMDTHYLELAGAILHSQDVWLYYIAYAETIEDHARQEIMQDVRETSTLSYAYRYLAAAKQHLACQGFALTAQRNGVPAAVSRLRRSKDAVAELVHLLH